jgi:hypothetical protein
MMACHKPRRPLPESNEAVLETKWRQGRLACSGVLLMTIVVAFLISCSAAVFLAHAFDAYQTR